MNIYLIGMCAAMAVFLVISLLVSRKVRDAEDFYVAGRRAPTSLIAGSIIASYIGVGLFMGDAAESFEGMFAPILILAVMQTAGYIIGSVFFGRYLRRSKALTIPEFFGERFCSRKMRTLSAITAIVMMSVYLLSVMQGIGTLMSLVTGVDYELCIVIALAVFTAISVISGSRGVLITDTLMALVFTLALAAASLAIAHDLGGWFPAIRQLASDPAMSDLLSWHGRLGVLYGSGAENMVWAFSYGIVWMSLCMVGPWQSSRYQMAKNEQVITRSGLWAALGVVLVEFLALMSGVMLNLAHPDVADPSHVMIWASMHLLPPILGVVLLVGILSAGISSATTFLSLIGASVANDIVRSSGRRSILAGRCAMIAAALAILAFAVLNPPSVFWIMYLGGAIVASSWMPVALASILSKRVTKTGAFCGMLIGFVSCFAVKLYVSLTGVSLPVYLDPSIVGMACNVIAMAIGSALTQVTPEEQAVRERLLVLPEAERDPEEIKKTMHSARLARLVGLLVTVMLLVFWVIPYLRSLRT